MADDSTQKWLGRNRPPRVQITYDLETRGAIEKKELPLVVGILADLAGLGGGDPDRKIETVADFKNRKFIEIDRDNFNDVMRSIGPALNLSVTGTDEKGQPLKISETISFENVDDFNPDRLVDNVTALKQVLTIRQRVNDLVGKLDGKPVDVQIKLLGDEQKAIAEQIAKLDKPAPASASTPAPAPAPATPPPPAPTPAPEPPPASNP